jgi:hypothetical protein
MTLTLWRGDRLLGELRRLPPDPLARPRRPDKGPELSAVLVPAPNASVGEGVWQVHLKIGPIDTVHQDDVEPDIVAERGKHAATKPKHPSSGALHLMTPEEERGVPVEVQLTVRDGQGRRFLPRQIWLREIRYEPSMREAVLREIPEGALVDDVVWWVFAAFASESEAPAMSAAHGT